MAGDLRSLFTESDRRAIADAARSAEGTTSGEIVPYVVGVCDAYPEVAWKAAVMGALLGGGGGVTTHGLAGVWGGSLWLWLVLPLLVGAVVMTGAARWSPALRRAFIGADTLDLRARRRAAMAFLEEEVFATRDRTGILIFVALFERRVVVLGDSGINRVVPEGAWQSVVDDVVAGIRGGEPAAALTDAIAECGRLLAVHRVEIRPDDTNELADELRIRER